MPYKHGAYGELVETTQQISTLNQGTIPFYVGTAPVHRLKDFSNAINKPILINNLDEAKTKIGYSDLDNFEKFTLSASVYAHFKNKLQPIGPIVVVNVLNPLENSKSDSEEIILINKIGYIAKDALISSVTVDTFKKDVDFILEYTPEGKIKFTAINDSITSPVTVNFNVADISMVSEKEIIGAYDPNTDKRTGLNNINIAYEELGVVPSVISAPGFNHKPNVEKALVEATKNIGGHWDAICVTDIDPTADTLEEAKKWKKENKYDNEREKVCWPFGEMNGKKMWMSILAIVRMQQTDFKNTGIPYESSSNKQLDITNLLIGDNPVKFNQEQGNKLNEKGITTAIYSGGKWVLWGPHMGNYEYGVTEISPSNFGKIFDINIRTNIYLSNDFQLRNAGLVDAPIARNDIDGIMNIEQIRLDALKSEGKILYGKIEFIPENNQINDLVQGNFVFNTAVTNTPPGKSLTNRIQYTSTGINTLLEGGDE
ncbi:hypothetical protein NRP93_003224 [Clostridium botulinum]|nr:hypothetical protein [Clostridium botulinum]